jgi:hypothetical protein
MNIGRKKLQAFEATMILAVSIWSRSLMSQRLRLPLSSGNYHYHDVTIKELSHLLTRPGLTHP